jgi:hypothetical protein
MSPVVTTKAPLAYILLTQNSFNPTPVMKLTKTHQAVIKEKNAKLYLILLLMGLLLMTNKPKTALAMLAKSNKILNIFFLPKSI